MGVGPIINYLCFLKNYAYNYYISLSLKRVNDLKDVTQVLRLYEQGVDDGPSRMVRFYLYLLKNKTLFYKSIDDKIVAYAFYIFKPGKEAHLHLIVTDEACRGRGLGKEVLDLSIDAMREVSNIISLNVDDDNTTAVDMYKKKGFAIERTFISGSKKRYYMTLTKNSTPSGSVQ